MTYVPVALDRRQFGLTAAAAAASLIAPAWARADGPERIKYCAFVKFLRALDYEQLADAMANAGFNGIEVTARKRDSYIHPDRAAEELPQLSEALAKRGLEISILTTDILHANEPLAEPLLRTAAKLGIARYRLGFYQYDLRRPILAQLTALEPVFRDIAAMNRDVGIAAVYQNHCGAAMMGATVWDLHHLINNRPATEIGCVFDIRHAAVEAGEAWPVYWNLMKPHVGAVSVKDFRWSGRRSQNVALGKGQVDPEFFKLLRQSDFAGPVSVHVEYLESKGADANVAALKADLATLRKWMES